MAPPRHWSEGRGRKDELASHRRSPQKLDRGRGRTRRGGRVAGSTGAGQTTPASPIPAWLASRRSGVARAAPRGRTSGPVGRPFTPRVLTLRQSRTR